MVCIFDLDGTLANCEHRRHFVDAAYRDDCYYHFPATLTQSEGWYYKDIFLMCEPPKAKKFIPDWKSFYEACDKDEPIIPVIQIFYSYYRELICPITKIKIDYIEIWSGRCESVRLKTEHWLFKNGFPLDINLKMRPIGDNTPDDQLKERWLDEAISKGKTIQFVFDDRPKVVRMWRRRGIFVFNCNQLDGEF